MLRDAEKDAEKLRASGLIRIEYTNSTITYVWYTELLKSKKPHFSTEEATDPSFEITGSNNSESIEETSTTSLSVQTYTSDHYNGQNFIPSSSENEIRRHEARGSLILDLIGSECLRPSFLKWIDDNDISQRSFLRKGEKGFCSSESKGYYSEETGLIAQIPMSCDRMG
jgi:hypothetical protein